MSIYEKMTAELEAQKDRSAWGRGVKAYALELVEELEERAAYEGRNPEPGAECREWMLNGAKDWNQYSWGGSSLIYNADIEEIRAILDFIDRNGKLYDVINAAEREFEGLFYDAPQYNMDILGVTPFGGEKLFEHIFGDDAEYMPSSFYDFRNEIEDEDDIPF